MVTHPNMKPSDFNTRRSHAHRPRGGRNAQRSSCAQSKLRLVYRATFALLAVATIWTDSVSARAQPIESFFSRTKHRVTAVTTQNGKALPVSRAGGAIPSAMDALNQYGRILGVTNPSQQLSPVRTWRDRFGNRHTLLRQKHNGVAVLTGEVKVHQDQRGDFLGANGDFHRLDPGFPTVATLSLDRAVALASINLEYTNPIVSENNLVIVDPGWYGDPPIGAHLAYHLIIRDGASAGATEFLVEAFSGKILDRWSHLSTARFRRVYDGMGEHDLPGTLARSEDDPPVGVPEDVDRAYDYAGDVYGFLARALHRDSVDDAGLPLNITVNSIAAACPNAFWESRLLQSAFCEATASDDIVAHEIGHALTLFTAGLLGQNQPGQLNESFADVFGELVDLYNGNVSRIGPPGGIPWPFSKTGGGLDTPNLRRSTCSKSPEFADGVRWLIGEDATAFGDALRDMWDPTCHGHPDRTGSELYTCPPLDNGGVHIGNSVVNHAFAMLVDGKEFHGYMIHAIGPEKATAVWFRALIVYLTVASNFEDAFHAFQQSAADLVGTIPDDPRTGLPTGNTFTDFDAQQVENALLATEMNLNGLCGVQQPLLDPSPAPRCASRTTLFHDDFENGAPGWTFENSGPPTPYDWVLTDDPLPSERAGHAMFCADRNVGDCLSTDESATHKATSPVIEIPANGERPMLSFDHFVAAETGRDGGNVEVRINGGSWKAIPPDAFLFNPYNARLRSELFDNTNPLAGQPVWSGAGGGWGTTLIDLGNFATGGDTLRIRFNFGKDACVGSDGWYVDDVEVFTCADCNLNGIPDAGDFHFTAVATTSATLGDQHPVSMTISPVPRTSSDVTLTTWVAADLNDVRESLTFFFNGVKVGSLYGQHGDALDCPSVTNRARLVIPQEQFNTLLADRTLTIDVVASRDVSPILCADGTFLEVLIDLLPVTTDNNGNQIPDECEGCTVPDPPTARANAVRSNRFISFVPPRTNRQTALRAHVVQMPDRFEAHLGEYVWIDTPFESTEEPTAQGDRVTGYARLTCDPVFVDWSLYDVIHVGDAIVVPQATFDVQAIDLACFGAPPTPPTNEGSDLYSPPLRIQTVESWGDLIGVTPADPPGNGPTVTDLAAMVDVLRRQGASLDRTRVDLIPAIPDLRVSVLEIVTVVDAIKGAGYPYEPPPQCD